MKLSFRILFTLLLSPLLCSCAAMFTGTKDDVMFTALPGQDMTPWTVTMKDRSSPLGTQFVDVPKKTKVVTFTNVAGESHALPMPRKFQGGYLLMDILFTPGFGLSGILVDSASSAYYDLPEIVSVDVERWLYPSYPTLTEIVNDHDGARAQEASTGGGDDRSSRAPRDPFAGR